MNVRKYGLLLVVALAFVSLLFLSLQMPTQEVSAAPPMAITPVAAEDPVSGDTALITFYNNQALTADSQNCIDLQGYRVLDLEYVSDHTLVAGANNTTTVILEHTNGAGASLAVNTAGQTVVSANAADADDLNRFDLFGRYTCVDIDVTSANPVTWTVIGVARK